MSHSSRIGRYRILRLLRQGGQGSVYLGYDEELQRRVAVKLYRLPDEREGRRLVLDEARAIASIENDRIVRIYDVISAGWHLAMIMEYVPGCDLEELQEQMPLSLQAVLDIGSELAAALAVVRQQGLVHGDLKASNVLVSEQGRVLLSDFGIASLSGSKAVAGSLTALTPEQLRGEPVDIRSDLFALACLLYRLISGRHPFVDASGVLDHQRLLTEEVAPLPAVMVDGSPVPEPLIHLLAHLLQKDPALRPDNTNDLRQVLRNLQREQARPITGSLLAGVQSHERGQTEDDLPPPIPRALQKERHSQLGDWRGFVDFGFNDIVRLSRQPYIQRWLLVLLSILVIVLVLVWPRAHRVELVVPVFQLQESFYRPPEVSEEWLRSRVCEAARKANANLSFFNAPDNCPSADAGFAGNRPGPPVDEVLDISLHCNNEFCLLGLTRQTKTESHYHQAVLFDDMSLLQWSNVTADLVTQVYTGDSL
ncbi:MAG: serine/threonine-protein kinase [Parahaliea sp.]